MSSLQPQQSQDAFAAPPLGMSPMDNGLCPPHLAMAPPMSMQRGPAMTSVLPVMPQHSMPPPPISTMVPPVSHSTVMTRATVPVMQPAPVPAPAPVSAQPAAGSSSQEDSNKPQENVKENTGRWTQEEHNLFLRGLEEHGKGWKKIASLIKTRTVVQIRTHAQKYFQKLAKAKAQGENVPVHMDVRSTAQSPRKASQKKKTTGKRKAASNSAVNSSSGNSTRSGAVSESDAGPMGYGVGRNTPAVMVPPPPGYIPPTSVTDSNGMLKFLSPLIMDAAVTSGHVPSEGSPTSVSDLGFPRFPSGSGSPESAANLFPVCESTTESMDYDALLSEPDSLDWLSAPDCGPLLPLLPASMLDDIGPAAATSSGSLSALPTTMPQQASLHAGQPVSFLSSWPSSPSACPTQRDAKRRRCCDLASDVDPLFDGTFDEGMFVSAILGEDDALVDMTA